MIGWFRNVDIDADWIGLQDYMHGFDDNGNMTAPILPLQTELNNAVLCDDMPALAGIQLGPTGRSVSRSYAATLSKLIPVGMSSPFVITLN
jgi:hypothetical protein